LPAVTPPPPESPGPLLLAGKIASDIPGTLVSLPTTITSVIDRDTKPRDVLRVHLDAGQTLALSMQSNGDYYIYIANPGSKSFSNSGYTGPNVCYGTCPSAPVTYVAAVTGDYYVDVATSMSAMPYTLALSIQ